MIFLDDKEFKQHYNNSRKRSLQRLEEQENMSKIEKEKQWKGVQKEGHQEEL